MKRLAYCGCGGCNLNLLGIENRKWGLMPILDGNVVRDLILDPVERASREIYKIFLKDGQLPTDKLIEATCETKCSRCGHQIKKGAKLMVVSYTYYPPRLPGVMYVIMPLRIPKTGYRILCEECSKDSTIKGVAKETWKKIFGIFR